MCRVFRVLLKFWVTELLLYTKFTAPSALEKRDTEKSGKGGVSAADVQAT